MHSNPVPPTSVSVGAEIRGLMAKRQITQADLATKLGLSQPAVARRLSGTVPLNVDELDVIAQALGVDPADLFAVIGGFRA